MGRGISDQRASGRMLRAHLSRSVVRSERPSGTLLYLLSAPVSPFRPDEWAARMTLLESDDGVEIVSWVDRPQGFRMVRAIFARPLARH